MSRALPVPITARAQLGVALSPYHLATRELPAMAAALLADRVVTLLPLPPGDESHARAHAEQSPAYAGVMEAWSWSAPLWEEGVLGARLHDDDAGRDLRDVLALLESRDELAELRPFIEGRAGGLDPRTWLDGVARDLIRGGPDPGWCVPLAAAMDRFAARHGLAAARAAPTSMAQRAEERLSRRVFAFAAPMLAQAPGERIVEARRTLGAPLGALRARMSEAFAAAIEGDETSSQDAALRLASDAFAQAFQDAKEELTRTPDDEDDPRVLEAMVSVTGVLLPSDAAVRSSLVALRRARGRGTPPRSNGTPPAWTAALVFRRIGR
ncbi:MAG: hypothetical protein R3B57_04610 [Phycisphaerales bacterium]